VLYAHSITPDLTVAVLTARLKFAEALDLSIKNSEF
jgi:hypothetical protein